jgi:ribosomal protein L28
LAETELRREPRDGVRGKARDAIRAKGRCPDDVGDGAARHEGSTGGPMSRHGREVLLATGARDADGVTAGWRRCGWAGRARAIIPSCFGLPGGADFSFGHRLEDFMARSCAICGKASMGGFNPQSTGMNRVRAHRRYLPNLQPTVIVRNGTPTRQLVCTRCRRTLTKSAR